MITKKLIEKVHNAFDELNYHENKQLDFHKFNHSAFDTLIHCKDLPDAINTVRMFQFCLAKWEKIEKIFDKKISLFNEYDYEGNSLISVVSDEESAGTYYITNGINGKINEIFIGSCSFDDKSVFMADFNRGGYKVFRDGNYYIEYSKLSSAKMKLFDKENKCMCNIVLSEGLGIFLENNITPYELVLYEDIVGIYDRKYINSLAPDETIDTNQLLADIEWDILKKNSDFGVAKLNTYAPGHDLEMFLLFATSTFLLYQRFMHKQEETVTLVGSMGRMFRTTTAIR